MILIALPALIYSNTLENTYHLDDDARVVQNTELEQFWPPTRFFTDVRTGSTNPAIAEYRPLMPLSHALDIQVSRIFGVPRLALFHVGNIAIHIASTILIYLLFLQLMTRWDASVLARLGDDTLHAAFAAALIFGVHPIAGSSVNYIVGRDLLLMTFFLLSSMLVYVGMRQRRDTVLGWVLCLGLLWLAMLAKQEAIIAFGFVFLFEVVLARARLLDWRLWLRTALVALPTAAYFVLRATWITKQNPGDGLRLPLGTEYPLTMLKAHLFYYLRNFAWPFEMRALAYYEPVQSLANPLALVGLAFILFTLVVAWRVYRRMPLLTFAILSYWLMFALTSSIFPFGYIVTDYRQYIPLAFLALATVLTCFTLGRRPVAIGLLGAFVAYSSVSSYEINTHWRTEESFWAQSVKYGGTDIAHVNYAYAVAERDPALGVQHYEEARRQNPYNVYANMNLGLLFIRLGQNDEGLTLLRDVVTRNPRLAAGHYWLSRALGTLERKDEQLSAAIRAAELDPPGLRYQYEAGRLLQSAGNLAGSVPYLERVVARNPGYEQALFLLGFAHRRLGAVDEAISEYERFLQFQPQHVQANFNLGYALMGRGGYQTAIEHFERVLELNPQYSETHLHLARCYRSLGNELKAAQHDALYRESQ